MIKLYGGARSRASIVKWYLEELQAPYEFQLLDMSAGEHLQPDFLAINPFGKVPAIADGDFQLWESGAILLYLAEKFGEVKTIEEKAIASQWVLFANSTLGTGLFVAESREKESPRLLSGLNKVLENQTYITGENFTVSDVAVATILGYAIMMLKMSYADYPAVDAYIKRISDRPAYQKAILGVS
ncbi:glutathione S-transferase family protein [Pseudanabaena sp. FACHB-1998]|uniref:glutathione S-transferase family protein n=1 Tax=Pseudanabaena sp. FACHB-1998 TaxID=2692858 RepID=UPI0016817FB7|nr:glutathione S-transferase family protein [Pseudanabaena sp. FACHB-1998]MBD2178824.1 glutathione S-transferase family protein [Pseudanabaena sp. FACHB-1998]